jgi:hypothetical protein
METYRPVGNGTGRVGAGRGAGRRVGKGAAWRRAHAELGATAVGTLGTVHRRSGTVTEVILQILSRGQGAARSEKRGLLFLNSTLGRSSYNLSLLTPPHSGMDPPVGGCPKGLPGDWLHDQTRGTPHPGLPAAMPRDEHPRWPIGEYSRLNIVLSRALGGSSDSIGGWRSASLPRRNEPQ